ncbi:hypothetical protein [Frankia gtarii]|uniref:hypothetical protein n=1 Tax=Frankia gtarii TaxID=2950102 RepID=UPI0021BE7302|nr:hypothetical protein [Frankia gtarii]
MTAPSAPAARRAASVLAATAAALTAHLTPPDSITEARASDAQRSVRRPAIPANSAEATRGTGEPSQIEPSGEVA